MTDSIAFVARDKTWQSKIIKALAEDIFFILFALGEISCSHVRVYANQVLHLLLGELLVPVRRLRRVLHETGSAFIQVVIGLALQRRVHPNKYAILKRKVFARENDVDIQDINYGIRCLFVIS